MFPSVLSPSIPAQRGQGPLIFIAGISGVSVNAATTGALVRHRWPGWLKIVRQYLVTRAGTRADLAGISLRTVDEDGDLVTDGQNVSALAPFAGALQWAGVGSNVAMMALSGWDWYPQARQFTRIVRPNEQWMFQIRNDGAAPSIPILAFEVEQLDQQLAGAAPQWTRGHKVL